MPRHYLRLMFAFKALFATGVVAVIYATAGKKIINMGTGNGEWTGFLSDEIGYIDTLVPILLAAFVVFVVIYIIASPAQEERAVRRRRR